MANFQFLELIGQPAVVLDSNFVILYANDYAKNRFDTIADINLQEGLDFIKIFTDSDHKLIGKSLIELLEELDHLGKKTYSHRLDISEELSMQLSFKKNYEDSIGDYWIITGINISSQIQEDRRLQVRYKEQLDVFKILFDMAPVGLGIKDFEGGFYKVNQGLSMITGYSKEELLEIKTDSLFPKFNSEKESKMIHSLIEQEKYTHRQEQIVRRKDTAIRVVSETINIIRDEINNPFLIIVSYLDITEEKELQRQLIESRKMEELGKLSGGLAHDFNNMLLPVTLCSDIALQEMGGMDFTNHPELIRIQSYIEKISISALRAKTLIQKLFQYSQSGEYKLIPIFLEKEIQKIVNLLLLQKPHNIELRLEVEEGNYPVMGESVWFDQLMENLVINSFHSMKFKESGTVTIRLFREYEDIIIEVEDQGVGIEDQELEKIFKPFYSNKKSDEGTGFGLIVVQTIIHKMSGKLQVYSNPGVGTVFQICLPDAHKKIKLQ